MSERKKRVLLAAAESTIRFKLLTHLNKAGFEVELASNAPIAAKKLAEGNFDVLALDSALPEMKGDDLIQDARQQDGIHPKPIFIYVTNGSADTWKKRANKLGNAKAFDKDTTPEFFVSELVAHIGFANVKPAAIRGPDRPAQRKAVVPELPADIKGFEIAWQKPKADTTVRAKASAPPPVPARVPEPIQPVDEEEPPADNEPARNKYWQAKVKEIGVENMKLQEKLANLAKERDHLATLLRSEGGEQFQRARAAAEAAEAGRQTERSRAERLESELGQLRLVHEKLSAKVSEEARVAAETKRHNEFLEAQIAKHNSEMSRLRSEFENRAAEHGTLEHDLAKQLAEAKVTAQTAELNARQEAEKASRFQAELARLLQARAELNGKFHETQQQNDKLVKELEHVRAEHSATQAELRQQLEAARQAAQNAQNAINEETAMFSRSHEKLLALQREHDDLRQRFAGEQQAAISYKRQVERLEEQLRDATAQLTRVKSELEVRVSERSSREADLIKQLAAARAAAERAEAGSKDEIAKAARVEAELNTLRHARSEWNEKVAVAERIRAEAQREVERLKSELQQQKLELASGIREQLQAAQSAASHAREELQNVRRAKDELAARIAAAEETADCASNAYKREMSRAEKLEKELIALRKARTQLTERLKDEQDEAEKFKRRVRDLAEDLERAKAELEGEMASRKRLRDSGALPAELSAVDQRVRNSVNALSRATADLEKERKRLENVSRRDPVDAARVGKAFINTYRKQLRTPADNLLQSIRRLVNVSHDQEQKRLAETALENAVVLQTRLSEEPILPVDVK
jgi:CheY-like chemotaxis protein